MASNPAGQGTLFLLLGISFALKSAFFPFHTWLPRAHSAAPAHVSALMSGVNHKAGLFAFLRFTLLGGRPEAWMGWSVLLFGAISAVFGSLYTSAQRDLKRILGYSSTENVGIAAMAFGVGMLGWAWSKPALVTLGFGAGLLHILNHALFKCLLFYAAGAVYRATHTVDLERLGGLARRMPWTAALFLTGGLAISALPPLNGFISELLIYAGLLNGSVPAGTQQLVLVLVAATLAFVGGVSALAMARSFGLTFLGAPRDRSVSVHGDASPSMRVTMIVHAAGVVALGFAPGLGMRVVKAPVALFARLTSHPDLAAIESTRSVLEPAARVGWLLIAVFAAVGALRWRALRRAPAARHVTWGCGYANASVRMQYTGTSFSQQFASLFQGVLLRLRREKLPSGPFPEKGSHLDTHCVDVVERRLFEALGEGEGIAARVTGRISEEPRFAFGLGLVVLGLLAFGAVWGGLR